MWATGRGVQKAQRALYFLGLSTISGSVNDCLCFNCFCSVPRSPAGKLARTIPTLAPFFIPFLTKSVYRYPNHNLWQIASHRNAWNSLSLACFSKSLVMLCKYFLAYQLNTHRRGWSVSPFLFLSWLLVIILYASLCGDLGLEGTGSGHRKTWTKSSVGGW